MPKQTGKSPLGSMIGKSLARNKGVPAKDTTFARLPGGISNGIAKFSVVHRGQYAKGDNKDEAFVQLRAIVVSPKTAVDVQKVYNKSTKKVETLSTNTVNIEGLQTSVMFPLCATGKGDKAKTAEGNMDALINQIKLMAGDDCFEKNGVETEEEFWEFLEALTKADLHFRFTTTASDPNEQYETQRTFENWGKSVSGGEVPEVDDEIVDNTEVETEDETTEEVEDGVTVENDEIPFDLNVLAESADNESDEYAQRQLTALAEEAGVPKIDVENSASWAEVAQMIKDADGSKEPENQEEEEDVEQEEWKPEVKQVWFYKPKGKRKGVESEVTAIFEGKKTCNVKLLDGSKTIFKGVPWSALMETAEG